MEKVLGKYSKAKFCGIDRYSKWRLVREFGLSAGHSMFNGTVIAFAIVDNMPLGHNILSGSGI